MEVTRGPSHHPYDSCKGQMGTQVICTWCLLLLLPFSVSSAGPLLSTSSNISTNHQQPPSICPVLDPGSNTVDAVARHVPRLSFPLAFGKGVSCQPQVIHFAALSSYIKTAALQVTAKPDTALTCPCPSAKQPHWLLALLLVACWQCSGWAPSSRGRPGH